MVEYTDDPHPRNGLWDMWSPPMFDLDEDEADVVMRDVNACREAHSHLYVKVVAYDRSKGRQTSALSFIVNRPEHEPGFRLERQETHDRVIRYTIHSYAGLNTPAGERYGGPGGDLAPVIAHGAKSATASRTASQRTRPWPRRSKPSPRSSTTTSRAMTPSRASSVQLDREMVGLGPVKERIREMAALLVIDQLRRDAGLQSGRPSLHMTFTGNPGTGKTTVALKMAEILYKLGYITKPKVVSVTRDDLVGQYVGHTAPKTRDVLKRAKGGVLFIDEAYYLYRPENERDYGQEAIEILLQVMETEREDLVVILAGYKDRMETFFRSNPGMGSRVAHHLHFPDFTPEELAADRRPHDGAAAVQVRARGSRRVRGVHQPAPRAAALRLRAQHPQRDRSRAHAPGRPAVRGPRQPQQGRSHDDQG